MTASSAARLIALNTSPRQVLLGQHDLCNEEKVTISLIGKQFHPDLDIPGVAVKVQWRNCLGREPLLVASLQAKEH
jgi:hypothetical protein